MNPGDSTPSPTAAVILASFGAGTVSACRGILNVFDLVKGTHPKAPVKLAFTSSTLRGIWRKKAARAEAHNIPPALRKVRGVLGAVADLSEDGHREIIVQPLFICWGEEQSDLENLARSLNSIQAMKPGQRPFDRIILSRPALGGPGVEHPYRLDLAKAAQALDADAALARGKAAALVYAGHGNPHFSLGVYNELEDMMRARHPGLAVYIGQVEGFPGTDRLMSRLAEDNIKDAVLAPLMLVAGKHAKEDIFEQNGSWQQRMRALGIKVHPVMRGLGELEAWAGIYLEHLEDACRESGVEL